MKENLAFNITGEFVTKTARDWFYKEKRPYQEVEKFLLSCMAGTDTPKAELQKQAQMVLLGQARFEGNTADGSYGLVILDRQEPIPEFFTFYDKFLREKKKADEDAENACRCLNNLRDALQALIDGDIDDSVAYLKNQMDDRRLLLDLMRKYGEEPVTIYSRPTDSFLDSFLKQARIEEKFEDNYGWLAPDGTFYPAEWGEHQGWAYKKAKELGYVISSLSFSKAGDILVDHGWVLLHNPSRGVAMVTRKETKPLTKAQREFLFNYYTDRDCPDDAKKYLEEGDL